MPGGWFRVEYVRGSLDHFESFLLEEDRVIDASIDDVSQSWCLKDDEIDHVVHANDVIVFRRCPMSFLDPEQTLFWKEASDNKLNASPLFKPLLQVVSGVLYSQLFVVRDLLVELTFVKDVHNHLFHDHLISRL